MMKVTNPNDDNASADLSNLRAYVNSRIAQGRENIKALFRDNVENSFRLGLIARLIRQREEGLPSQIFWEESWDSVPARFSEEDLEQVKAEMQAQVWAVPPGGVCPEPINPKKEAKDEG